MGEQNPDGAPILGFDWKRDNSMVFMASASGMAKAWDLKENKVVDIGNHTAPVRDIFHVPGLNDSVCTSSWDGFIKFWDCRSPNPILEQNVG